MTTYRVAMTQPDYEAVEQFSLRCQMGKPDLTFPTIMAERDGKLVGAMATVKSDEYVSAGPLITPPEKRCPLLTFHMISLYDQVMQGLGIKSVIFGTEGGGPLCRAVQRFAPGLKPYAMSKGIAWYIWPIGQLHNYQDKGVPA